MKLTRVLALFVLVMGGAIVEAQCLKCYRTPGTWSGTCGESFDEYCDRQCCGEYIGKGCSIPDFIDPCDPWLSRSAGPASLVRTTPSASAPARSYFTSRQPVELRRESLHRRLQKLDPAAPKCPART